MALPDAACRVIGWFSTTHFDRVVRPIDIPVIRLEPRFKEAQ